MPEHHAPPDASDLTLSQMMSEMRVLAKKRPQFPTADGFFTAYELKHVNGANISHQTLNMLLDAARDAGRLQEEKDFRPMRGGGMRQVPVYRITPPEPTKDD